MEQKDLELIEKNLEKDNELKGLWVEHQHFEQQLEKIEKKPFLTAEEKVEKKRIQVAKLAGKTRIEEILNKYRGPELQA